MEQGFIENGFIVDVSNAKKTSEIIYQLSNILDLPDAHCKKVCIKLGNIVLSSSELVSIKALVESMNSEIEFVSTESQETANAAQEIGLKVSDIENKVPTPVFNQNVEETQQTNMELEKALDKIFGDSDLNEQTFSTHTEIKKLQDASSSVVAEEPPVLSEFKSEEDVQDDPSPAEELPQDEISAEFEKSMPDHPQEETAEDEDLRQEFAELEDFNRQLEKVNREVMEIYEEKDDFTQLQKSLRETEKLPTLYIQRTLRSGQSITADGNIVIIGDVNPGSEIKAKGDITVWGILGGIAHAGAEGNKYARIRALKMHAIQLRIADVFARRPDGINIPYIQKTDTFTPEEARVKNKQIIISKLYEN